MSAYDGIIWGSGEKGQIGIKLSQTVNSETLVTQRIDIYYRSKYSVRDSVNNFYYQFYEGGATSIGSVNINHSSNSAWSENNITYVGYYTGGFKRTKYEQTGTCKAWYNTIEATNSGEVSANFKVPPIPSYTVSYNANGGTNAPSNQIKWYGENLIMTSQIPTRTGYTFVGWGTSPTSTNVTMLPSGIITGNYNIVFYAIWKPNTYEVLYDANGGENAPSGQTKLYGVTLPLQTAIPTRTNYNFLGWSTNNSATTPTYLSGANYTNNASVTLYAVWELAYIKPRINNLTVFRCNSDGTEEEEGTNVKIKFDWETDKTNARYVIYYKKNSETDYLSGIAVDMNGTSGSVETIIKNTSGNVIFDNEYSYDIQLNVSDSLGYSYSDKIINALFIPIDSTEDGRCMSFGEPAKDDEKDVLRLAYKIVDIAPKDQLLFNGQPFEEYIRSIISTLL